LRLVEGQQRRRASIFNRALAHGTGFQTKLHQRWNKIENAAFGVLRRDVPFGRGGISIQYKSIGLGVAL
jgi:hypothetical protein